MMYLILQLFATFFLIGLFNFGGGGAMISLIQTQVVTVHGWVSEEVFANIVAVSQSTPGPIGINCATYVGYQVLADSGYSGLVATLGSLTATFAVVLPSFLIFWVLMHFYDRHRTSRGFKSVMAALKPAVAGMMGAAALALTLRVCPGGDGPAIQVIEANFADWTSWALAAAAFAAAMWTKISPIWIILAAGCIGLIIY